MTPTKDSFHYYTRQREPKQNSKGTFQPARQKRRDTTKSTMITRSILKY